MLRAAEDHRACCESPAPLNLQGEMGLHFAATAYNLVRVRNLAMRAT